MLKVAIGHTEEMEADSALADVLSQCVVALDGQQPKAAVLLASHDLEAEDFLAMLIGSFLKLLSQCRDSIVAVVQFVAQ